jgi:ParB family chromosome partitioning protein
LAIAVAVLFYFHFSSNKQNKSMAAKSSCAKGCVIAYFEMDSIQNHFDYYKQIIEENLSVRAIENLVKNVALPTKKSSVKSTGLNQSHKVFKDFIGNRLSTKVSIQKSENGSGKLSIHFNSESDLNRIIELLKH